MGSRTSNSIAIENFATKWHTGNLMFLDVYTLVILHV